MSDKEMKFVTRQETFNDLAVRELARGRSACICKLQFGRCKKSECKKCPIYKQYASCYSELSDYDRQRLASYVHERYLQDSLWPDKWKASNDYVRYEMLQFLWFSVWFILGFAIFGLLLWFVCEVPCSRPPTPRNVSDKVVFTMLDNQRNVQDYNDDGVVNCVDYACGFKWRWDMLYPEYADCCQIIRNVNPLKDMNHLFVIVGDVEVETWAPDPFIYDMELNWPNGRYDRKYNIYGETELWMRKCQRSLNQSM